MILLQLTGVKLSIWVNIALKLYCSYTFCCVFIRLIIPAIFRLLGRRRKGLRRGEEFMQAWSNRNSVQAKLHILTSEKVLGSAFKWRKARKRWECTCNKVATLHVLARRQAVQVSVISQKALWTIYNPNNDSKGIVIYWQMDPLTKCVDGLKVASNTQKLRNYRLSNWITSSLCSLNFLVPIFFPH